MTSVNQVSGISEPHRAEVHLVCRRIFTHPLHIRAEVSEAERVGWHFTNVP